MLGYLGAILVGITLGLIGGGGSIITVPLLVYVMGLNPVVATAYSLFVVGVSSLVGAIKNIQKKQVDFKAAIAFAVPAFISVFLTRKFIVPAIPEIIFSVGSFTVTKHIFIMVFFAVIMILASVSMIKNFQFETGEKDREFNPPIIILQAIVLGLVTGIVGAGGGFLIVPALVLLVHIPMKRAVATSLLIIAVNSLIGFLGDLGEMTIDWTFLLTFTACSIGGIFLGIYLNKFIDGKKLKKSFGWFVLLMGAYIVAKELFL
ncbi:hypothetical protein SAMN05216480_101505 [Pustulibacterium marinum]|uniref:Probable membrane transporter protein n=1 Tax=Pustulibacterium marinum TaxID=1224947 RepID=A0A1I7F0J4_9FLAO|nr:hypothetical protein SAMN05216480_101505 [Pustulibacterium marinum]